MDILPDLPLCEFARAQALERLEDVSRHMRRVRSDTEADAVHDLRVSVRRLSSVLQTFPECFSRGRAAKARKRLQRILKAAGEVRDRDIALSLAAKAANGNPTESQAPLEEERREAARKLQRLLAKDRRRKTLAAGKRSLRLRKKWKTKPDQGGRWSPAAAASENAVDRLPALMGELFDAGRQALSKPVDLAKLHELRLKTKRRRYILELFAPCYDAGLTQRVGQLKHLQDLLGEISDYRASRELAQTDEMRAFLDAQPDRLIAELGRFWIGSFDGPGECEGWMLELARRSSTESAAGPAEDTQPAAATG